MNILEKQKNDEIEGTFCYELFENSFFDINLCQNLLSELPNIPKTQASSEILKWIISCTDICFASHHDKNDLYKIKNYTQRIEANWREYKLFLEQYIL